MADSPKVFCKFCDTLVTIKEACCSDCYKPAHVRLSAEMLGEEDRETLEFAKGVLLQFRSNMDMHRNKAIEREEMTDIVNHYERERDMAHKGVLLILRMLGSADANGGE